jgi:hypothetical protein
MFQTYLNIWLLEIGMTLPEIKIICLVINHLKKKGILSKSGVFWKRVLQGKQTHESHTELSFMMIDNKIIKDLETSLNVMYVCVWWIFLLKQKLLLAADSVTRCHNKR